MRRVASFLLVTWSMPTAAQDASHALRPITISGVIESSRFMTDRNGNAVFFSPSGSKYAVGTVSGDVARNELVYTIFVGSTGTNAKPRKLIELRASGLEPTTGVGAGSSLLGFPGINPITWESNDTLLLMWTDNKNVKQIVGISSVSAKMTYLTSEPRDVASFASGAHGIIYAYHLEPERRPTAVELANGYSVVASNLTQLLEDVDPYDAHYSVGYRVLRPVSGQARDVLLNGKLFINRIHDPRGLPPISPNGRYAAIDATVDYSPPHWDKYGPEIAGRAAALAVGKEADGFYPRQLRRSYLLDLATAKATYMLDAPSSTESGQIIAWSPDSRLLASGPTYLPRTNSMGREGNCTVVIDIESKKLAVAQSPCAEPMKLSWISNVELLVEARGRQRVTWRNTNSTCSSGRGRPLRSRRTLNENITAQYLVEQDENSPPALVRRIGKARHVLLDPNKDLKASFRISRAEPYEWTDASGRRWSGTLYRAIRSTAPGPVVIQTRGLGPNGKFTLTGYEVGLGPFGAPYLAQPLASAGISVLQIPDRPPISGQSVGQHTTKPSEEAEFFREIYDGAYSKLVKDGIADPSKVGLMGHSRSGWWVLYTLTHSTVPYAAAIVNDNIDGSYWQAALTGFQPGLLDFNGGYPDGAIWQRWLSLSPEFNVGRIRSPVLMISASLPSVSGAWGSFARMRSQEIPVELFVVPRARQGAHFLQNPQQIAGSAGRALSWWRYWLTDNRTTSEGVYPPSWKKLSSQREALTTTPRPPLNGTAVFDVQ